MKQEEKQLLLKDLSARLPYIPIVQISLFRNDGRKRDIDLDPHVTENIWEIIDKYHALPYLRPMSSMTEEEKKEYHNLCYEEEREELEFGEWITRVYYHNTIESIDWLNAHHFDYRGLIERGLALEMPKKVKE